MSSVGYLRQRSERRLHRSNFTDADFQDAFTVVTSELGEDLRSQANQTILEVAEGWTNPYDLPADFRAMRYVKIAASGGDKNLLPENYLKIVQWSRASGTPGFYAVVDNQLNVAPNGSQAMTVIYFNEPAALDATDDASSNRTLDAYPNLYLVGVLRELSMITQDSELASAYHQQFTMRIQSINEQTNWDAYGASPAASRG